MSLEYALCLPPQSLYPPTAKPVRFAVCLLIMRAKFTLMLDPLGVGSVSTQGSAALLHQRVVSMRAIAKSRMQITTARLALVFPFLLLCRLRLIDERPRPEKISAVLVFPWPLLMKCLAAEIIGWMTPELSLQQLLKSRFALKSGQSTESWLYVL